MAKFNEACTFLAESVRERDGNAAMWVKYLSRIPSELKLKLASTMERCPTTLVTKHLVPSEMTNLSLTYRY